MRLGSDCGAIFIEKIFNFILEIILLKLMEFDSSRYNSIKLKSKSMTAVIKWFRVHCAGGPAYFILKYCS